MAEILFRHHRDVHGQEEPGQCTQAGASLSFQCLSTRQDHHYAMSESLELFSLFRRPGSRAVNPCPPRSNARVLGGWYIIRGSVGMLALEAHRTVSGSSQLSRTNMLD